MIHLENENFDELIKDKVVVDFFATWCGPCKMLGPVFEELSTEINDIKFIKVDIDEHEDLCRKYKVMSVPTLIVFDKGKEVKRNIGFIPKDKLKEFIK
ncbi:MAG: thioredoxin [Bacilli bacterium]|nr:thioredoxin [Bacilli bacterium]